MIILALDPGSENTAWCLFDTVNEDPLYWGLESNKEVLSKVKTNSFPITYNHLVVEMIQSFGMPVGQTVFTTCVWIGRFIEAWQKQYTFVYRNEEKIEICNSMKANDATIKQALIDIYGPPGTKKNPGKLFGMSKDMWSALAVALTFTRIYGGSNVRV